NPHVLRVRSGLSTLPALKNLIFRSHLSSVKIAFSAFYCGSSTKNVTADSFLNNKSSIDNFDRGLIVQC
ncbi:MAG: hypothetical protein RR652_00320, partial [Mucinivorans sp.]